MHKRKALNWLISFGVHGAIVAAVVIAPMLFSRVSRLMRIVTAR